MTWKTAVDNGFLRSLGWNAYHDLAKFLVSRNGGDKLSGTTQDMSTAGLGTDNPPSLEGCPRPLSLAEQQAFKAVYRRGVQRAVEGFLANAPKREQRARWRGRR
jgi:hypothetical protein